TLDRASPFDLTAIQSGISGIAPAIYLGTLHLRFTAAVTACTVLDTTAEGVGGFVTDAGHPGHWITPLVPTVAAGATHGVSVLGPPGQQ
ncbi:MAG TPA: hypothetical protein VNL71_09100, partial [Chloroflexota bacterium]|nr:hypothetical protein [Chloroflexota bacterium]